MKQLLERLAGIWKGLCVNYDFFHIETYMTLTHNRNINFSFDVIQLYQYLITNADCNKFKVTVLCYTMYRTNQSLNKICNLNIALTSCAKSHVND